MNYLLITCLICLSTQFTITEVEENPSYIKIHPNEHKTIILNDARDAILQSYNNSRGCEISPLQVKFETQEFRIIQIEDFKDKDFESDTVLNFRQFVSMVHIKDGILAITSDSIAYLLKFNYKTVFQHDIQESGQQFARILWRADLQTIAPSLIAKNELPQLLFSPSFNLAFLLFSDSAQLFSMEQMESKATSLDVYQVTDWKKRGYRGLTKEIDGLVFSAVGREGIDVYKVIQNDLRFIKNLKLQDFGLNSSIEIVDFSIVKHGSIEGYYSMFLLDRECGLFLIDVHKNQQINFGFRSWINIQKGGISVDTRNGRNVFMAFYQMNHYYVLEYIVNLDNGTSSLIRQKKINHRIIDLDATDEFVIVQGVNQHLILYSNGYDFVMNHHQDQVFTHIGLRDFVFFNQSYKLEEIQNISQEYQYDDFFFGITAQSAFLTRFQVEPIKINCFYHQYDVGHSFAFNLQYNTTVDDVQDLVIRHNQKVTLEIVKTYFYEAEYYLLYAIGFLFGSIFLMGMGFLGYWYCNIQKQHNILVEQIEKTAREKGIKQVDGSTSLKGDETSVFQQQNKSIQP